MNKKSKVERAYHLFCDLIEVYIPCVIFIFLFVSYVILIFYRYVLRSSVDWLYELNTIAFVWGGILAASYGSRKGTHVQFTILYDHVSPRTQQIMRIVGNVFIVVILCILFPKAGAAMKFMKIRKSSVLKTTFDIIFAPFMIYLGLTIVHHAVVVVQDVLKLIRKDEKEAAQ